MRKQDDSVPGRHTRLDGVVGATTTPGPQQLRKTSAGQIPATLRPGFTVARVLVITVATLLLRTGALGQTEAELLATIETRQDARAALQLVQRGQAAAPFLVQGLQNDKRTAALCAWALARHPLPGTAAALRGRLRHVDQVAGYYAARALGKMPSPENVSALSALLAGEPNGYWELSAGGVGRLRDAWNDKGQRYSEPAPTNMANLRVAYAAMESLGELGGEQAAITLLKALESDQYLIRYGAARGLGQMRWRTAEANLVLLAEKDPVLIVRQAAKQALAAIRGAVPAEFDLLRTSPAWSALTPALSPGRGGAHTSFDPTQSLSANLARGDAAKDRHSGSGRIRAPSPGGSPQSRDREGRGEGETHERSRASALELEPSRALAFIKTKLRSDATFGFRDSYFFPKTPRYHSGENLYTLTPPRPGGALRNLTALSNGEVQGPEVSFDGTRILFAMRRDKARDGFHIFEINSDGSGLRQLTDGNCNDADPCYLPDGRIAFCSDRCGWQEYYHQERSRVLYVMNGDGSGLQQITFNPNQDYEPFALGDGRISYSSYRFYAQDGSEGPLPGEWMGLARIETVLRTCNPDGSADNLFYGSMRGSFYVPMRPMPFGDQFAGWHRRGYHVGVSVSQQKEMPDGRIICATPAGLTLVDPLLAPLDCEMPIFPEVVNLAGGEEVYIHNYDPMNPVGRFTSPYPAGGDWVWVSHAPWHDLRVNGYGLYLLNVATRELELVFDDPEMSDVDPVPLAPQRKPLIRASTLRGAASPLTRPSGTLSPSEGERDAVRGRATGLIICNSVFNTDQPFDRKSVRYVRVLEGVQMGQSIAANAAFRTRILGTAPIHADGSFYVEVPADVPVRFELLDADGRMLIHETEFNYVRPGETKGCIGCHENRKAASPNFQPMALGDPPIRALRQPGDLIYMGQRARPYNKVYRD